MPKKYDESNPYAAPEELLDDELPEGDGYPVYRDGKYLVARREDSEWPKRCVKTNVPTNNLKTIRLYWHPPVYFGLLVLNLLIYAIVAVIVRKKAVVDVPISAEYAAKRSWRIAIAWAFGLTSFATGIFLLASNDRQDEMRAVISFGLLMAVPVITAVAGIILTRIVYPRKMNDRYAWIAGVSPEYLEELPIGAIDN